MLFLFCLLYISNLVIAQDHTDIIQEIKSINKVELHLHLGGSWPLAYLQEIAEPEQIDKLLHLLDQIDNRMDYQEAFQVFEVISKIVNTDQRVENGVVALCKNLVEDGVVYVEIRTGLKNLGSGVEGYLNAIMRGIEHGCAHTNLKADIVLSVRRDTPASSIQQTIELITKYRTKGVVGLDISGISTQGDGNSIFQSIAQIKENHIPITLHIGESRLENSEQQMKELQLLKPKRIGHAVFLCEPAKEWILANKIPVELCLTSAVKVGMIADYDQHPALQLLEQGHPVIICTDDPLIFKTTLSQECARVAEINKLTVEEIIKLQESALNYRFNAIIY